MRMPDIEREIIYGNGEMEIDASAELRGRLCQDPASRKNVPWGKIEVMGMMGDFKAGILSYLEKFYLSCYSGKSRFPVSESIALKSTTGFSLSLDLLTLPS